MNKFLIAVIAIIVIVAIFMVAQHFQGVKFGSLGSLFKVNYTVPSGLSHNASTKTNITYSTGGNPPAAVAPKPQPTPPAGFTVAELSPYYGEVKIGNVSPASTWNTVANFSLSANYNGLKAPIDVTGWHLRSNKGDVVIPTAVADYTPGGFGYSGDITLSPGQVLNVYSSVSPIAKNLRMNQCIGYLNDTYTFTPALPQNCASVYDRSEISTLSGACQSYILSLWSCSAPSIGQINNFSSEPACQALLSTRFNYATCYDRHRFDSGFFTNEWRVWIGGAINFDQSHDRLLLFDKEGLLVDEYTY